MSELLAGLLSEPLEGTAAAAPARLRVLEALARRAQAQPPGPLREALLERLRARLARWLAQPAVAPQARPVAQPLGLLTHLDPDQRDLRAADLDRRGWTRLRVERRLAEPVAPPAAALGPLHTQVLLPRALQLLRELSPEYLERLLGAVDQLAALTTQPPAAEPRAKPRGKLRP